MASRVILFIHGYLGSSTQFNLLRQHLADVSETDLLCLTLPGHEGTLRSFMCTTAGQWQQAVSERLAVLQTEYDEILLVGHSMGGLLAIHAAIVDARKIRGIVALALPLRLRFTLNTLRMRLGALRPPHAREDVRIQAARQMCGISDLRISNVWRLLPSTFMLLQLMRQAKTELCSLKPKLAVFNSVADEIVSSQTIRLVQKALPQSKIVLLTQSSHFWYSAEEAKQISTFIRRQWNAPWKEQSDQRLV